MVTAYGPSQTFQQLFNRPNGSALFAAWVAWIVFDAGPSSYLTPEGTENAILVPQFKSSDIALRKLAFWLLHHHKQNEGELPSDFYIAQFFVVPKVAGNSQTPKANVPRTKAPPAKRDQYQCVWCGWEGYTKEKARQHLISLHLCLKPLKCSVEDW